jgi:hypothetical protein
VAWRRWTPPKGARLPARAAGRRRRGAPPISSRPPRPAPPAAKGAWPGVRTGRGGRRVHSREGVALTARSASRREPLLLRPRRAAAASPAPGKEAAAGIVHTMLYTRREPRTAWRHGPGRSTPVGGGRKEASRHAAGTAPAGLALSAHGPYEERERSGAPPRTGGSPYAVAQIRGCERRVRKAKRRNRRTVRERFFS